MHERQAILSTTVVLSHIFCMENENELTPEGRGNNHVMLSCKSAIRWRAKGAIASSFRVLFRACQLSFTVYSFPRLVQLFLYAIALSQSLMATRTAAPGSSSSFRPSESCSSAPVHKWTCSALRTWLKARGLSYSGMKKDELVAKQVLMQHSFTSGIQ